MSDFPRLNTAQEGLRFAEETHEMVWDNFANIAPRRHPRYWRRYGLIMARLAHAKAEQERRRGERSMSVCPYCEDGVCVSLVSHGIGPTRVYELVRERCWDCQGSGVGAEPAVFHGLDQASLDSILKETE